MTQFTAPYTVKIIPHDLVPEGVALDAADDSVDVFVEFETGEHYCATFFTLQNLRTLMRRYRDSGECRGGLYVWATDMIVVETLTRDVIEAAVDDLIQSGELASAFSGPHRPALDA